MFDIGIWEIALILLIALLVVGPERLPGLARKLGLWINRARRIFSEVKGDVERELRMEELKHSLRQPDGVDDMKKLADRVKAINADLSLEGSERMATGNISSLSTKSDQTDSSSTPPPPSSDSLMK